MIFILWSKYMQMLRLHEAQIAKNRLRGSGEITTALSGKADHQQPSLTKHLLSSHSHFYLISFTFDELYVREYRRSLWTFITIYLFIYLFLNNASRIPFFKVIFFWTICLIPEATQDQAGCSSGQPGLAVGDPAHSRGVEIKWSLTFFSI